MTKTIEVLKKELDALRRSRDLAATQIHIAINALEAGNITLSDTSTRIQRISICVEKLEADEDKQ